MPLFAEESIPGGKLVGLTYEIGTSIVLSLGKYVPGYGSPLGGHQEHLVYLDGNSVDHIVFQTITTKTHQINRKLASV